MNKTAVNAIAALSLLALPVSAQQTTDVIVVFDASGSMWGQIEGVSKIEIARDAFQDLSADWAATGTNVGLIAYGHRRKGDCSDIELIAAPEAGSTARLGALVQNLIPRGKTPLSDAVRLAAETLKFTEEAATVVLVSDGRETCGRNTCEVGAELARLGVDFTAHVIGFDVNDSEARTQLECLAQNTGGQYFDAADASALSNALGQISTLEVPAEPTPDAVNMVRMNIGLHMASGTARPAQVSFRATNQESGELVVLGSLKGAKQVISGLNSELPEGRWTIEAVSDEGAGSIDVTLRNDGEEIDVPFAAFPLSFKLADTGSFLLGVDQTILLVPSVNIQKNAQLVVGMFPAGSLDYGERMDHSFQFGAEAGQTLEHRFDSPPIAGDYDIIVLMGNDLNDVFFRQTITYETEVVPTWLGARHGEPGGNLPLLIGGVTNPFATLELHLDGRKVWGDWYQDMLSDAGANLPLPTEDGIYTLIYKYKNAAGKKVVADLGTLTLGAAVLMDDADAVEAPSAAAEPLTKTSGVQIAYLCDQDFCQQDAEKFGLSWALSLGWGAEAPFYYTTAAGVKADLPSMTFVALQNGSNHVTAQLNPHQWPASNGPCFPVSRGELCRFGSMNTSESPAFEALLTSLREVPLSDVPLTSTDIDTYFSQALDEAN